MIRVVVIAALLALFMGRRASAKVPSRTTDPDTPDLPSDEPSEDRKLADVFTDFVTQQPRFGRGYIVQKDDIFFGNDGIIARAYRNSINRNPTPQEAIAYYKAIGRVRSNWRLYGTLSGQQTPAGERFDVRNADGAMVSGTITAALCPWNDRWGLAIAQGELPRRLIGWTRKNVQGACASLRRADNYQQINHGVVNARGVVWLPPVIANGLGVEVTYDPAMDWPAELYAIAGTSWEEWTP